MAWMVGRVECQCRNVMGMPTDTGECQVCGERRSFYGENTLRQLEEWAKQHAATHGDDAV